METVSTPVGGGLSLVIPQHLGDVGSGCGAQWLRAWIPGPGCLGLMPPTSWATLGDLFTLFGKDTEY